MDCSGIVFKNGGRSTFAVNMPVHAIDTSGRAFNIYIKEQYPPVFLVEYTH